MNNSSVPTANKNESISNSNGDESSGSYIFVSSSALIITETVILLLAIILAIAYIALILIRPTLRNNKLNWFTINICLTSVWLSIILVWTGTLQLLNVPISLSCRLQAFLTDMGVCLLTYSHCVVAISRLLTIVYGNKRFFRSNICLWGCTATGWLIAVLAALPYLFADGFTCSSSTQAAFLPYYTLIATLLLPITIITVCNARTLLFVRNSTRRVHAANTGGQVSHTHDVLLLKIMIGTFISFLVGWTPLFVTQLFNRTTYIPTIVNACFQILPSLAILHGIILLIATNQPVRIFVKQLFIRRPQRLQVNMNRGGHQLNTTNH